MKTFSELKIDDILYCIPEKIDKIFTCFVHSIIKVNYDQIIIKVVTVDEISFDFTLNQKDYLSNSVLVTNTLEKHFVSSDKQLCVNAFNAYINSLIEELKLKIKNT